MSKPRAFKKLSSQDETFSIAQTNVKSALEPIIRSEILDGVLLRNITITSGVSNMVEHKLDREPRGYLVVRQRAQAQVWDNQDENTLKRRTLDLRTNATVVVDLWVF